MNPRIEKLFEKKLIGKKVTMSLEDNRTGELWQSFMKRRYEIKNAIGAELYSVQVYDQSYFSNFSLNVEFKKWAAIEVADYDSIPLGMEPITLGSGLYAVFVHRGAQITAMKTFQYIFERWLPNSEYILDDRPHFEVLGERYKNNDINSEEEIWIPIHLQNDVVK